jgi:hypothetical protein
MFSGNVPSQGMNFATPPRQPTPDMFPIPYPPDFQGGAPMVLPANGPQGMYFNYPIGGPQGYVQPMPGAGPGMSMMGFSQMVAMQPPINAVPGKPQMGWGPMMPPGPGQYPPQGQYPPNIQQFQPGQVMLLGPGSGGIMPPMPRHMSQQIQGGQRRYPQHSRGRNNSQNSGYGHNSSRGYRNYNNNGPNDGTGNSRHLVISTLG